jgi:DNA-binding protein HU-beta
MFTLGTEPPWFRIKGGLVNKGELVSTVAEEAGCSNAQAEQIIGALFSSIVASAQSGDKVAWPGFGSFSISQRAARTGRNPQTGETINIAASKALRFSPAAALKATLNGR